SNASAAAARGPARRPRNLSEFRSMRTDTFRIGSLQVFKLRKIVDEAELADARRQRVGGLELRHQGGYPGGCFVRVDLDQVADLSPEDVDLHLKAFARRRDALFDDAGLRLRLTERGHRLSRLRSGEFEHGLAGIGV